MAPKADDKKLAQAKQKAAQQKIEDKTFGMKNKNKSKAVQQQIAQMKHGLGLDSRQPNKADLAKKAAADAINSVLFQEAKSKKDLAREALAKAAAAEEKKKAKEPEKRDIFVDTRDLKKDKEEDDMADWDESKLKDVVNQKSKGQGQRVATDIICKHFIAAVENRTYGWFWECPNGGDKCQYRHALPEGYVLKRDRVDEVVDEGPKFEDVIEEKRRALTSRTPVTLERLQAWLAAKKAAQEAAEAKEMDDLRKAYAKTGKAAGVTGKQLFAIDSSLFVDDAAAGADEYTREESDDEGEEGEEGKASGGAVTSGSKAETFVPLQVGDIRPPTPPPPPTADPPAAEASAVCPPGGPAADDDDDDDDDDDAEPDLNAAAGASTSGSASGGGGASGGGEPSYATNYEAGGGGGGAASSSAGAAGASVDITDTDLEGVDESLFLDEDLPDDDDLE